MKADPVQIKLIVGLGNPGVEYANTRHNIGFMVLEKLLAGFPAGRFEEISLANSRIFAGRHRGKELHLQMPLTYMNLSGSAVANLAGKLKLQRPEILVVSDDLDLPFGRLRLREGGSDGGHNGLKSIIAELGGADFKRLRVGIGRPENSHQGADYVLAKFTESEAEQLEKTLTAATGALKMVLAGGIKRAMNEVNRKEPAANENDITQTNQ